MSDEIIKLLNDLSSRFGVVIDWSSKNMTPYLQELLQKYTKYEIVLNIFYIVLCVVIAVVCVIIGIKLVKLDFEFSPTVLFFIAFFAIVIGVIFATRLITVCTFPEKLIITELKTLLSR
ncbi:MAG: hypothetical protein V8S76_00460 [Lachnospiraceae bacterium]